MYKIREIIAGKGIIWKGIHILYGEKNGRCDEKILNKIKKYYIIYTKAKMGIFIGNKRLLYSFCVVFPIRAAVPFRGEGRQEPDKRLYIKRGIGRGFSQKGRCSGKSACTDFQVYADAAAGKERQEKEMLRQRARMVL